MGKLFGVTNSHTDQAVVESRQGIVRKIVRPFMEQISAESKEDEVAVAVPIVCHTLNATKNPFTGISPFDVYSPMNSTDRPLFDLPEGASIKDQAALVSLVLELQANFLAVLEKDHKTYLKKIKYKTKVDEYPEPGDLLMIQYERLPHKDAMRNYGPFQVVEIIDKLGIPYAVMTDLNNVLKKHIVRALSECVFYNHDSRNLSPAEVAAKGTEFTVVEAIIAHEGTAAAKTDMIFTVQWAGGLTSQEPWKVVKQLKALDVSMLGG